MAHFGRVGIVLSPRLNNNTCHYWHNAQPRKTLNCKLVKRSRELLNWSRCVSWFIAPADQILQWTWKKKLSRIGSSFRALRKPDPPITSSYSSSILLTKTARRSNCKFMVKKFTNAEKFVGSRRQCSTSSECPAAWLPVQGACSRSYWARNRGKHSAISAKDPNHGGRKKEERIRTKIWIKLSIKPEEINFNQTIIFLCPLFSGSELKYFKKALLQKLNLLTRHFWLNCFRGSM